MKTGVSRACDRSAGALQVGSVWCLESDLAGSQTRKGPNARSLVNTYLKNQSFRVFIRSVRECSGMFPFPLAGMDAPIASPFLSARRRSGSWSASGTLMKNTHGRSVRSQLAHWRLARGRLDGTCRRWPRSPSTGVKTTRLIMRLALSPRRSGLRWL